MTSLQHYYIVNLYLKQIIYYLTHGYIYVIIVVIIIIITSHTIESYFTYHHQP
jgi:hypothetical protein